MILTKIQTRTQTQTQWLYWISVWVLRLRIDLDPDSDLELMTFLSFQSGYGWFGSRLDPVPSLNLLHGREDLTIINRHYLMIKTVSDTCCCHKAYAIFWRYRHLPVMLCYAPDNLMIFLRCSCNWKYREKIVIFKFQWMHDAQRMPRVWRSRAKRFLLLPFSLESGLTGRNCSIQS